MRKSVKSSSKGGPEKTLWHWVDLYIKELRDLEDIVIVWENIKTNDAGDDVLVSVDTINLRFQQIKC